MKYRNPDIRAFQILGFALLLRAEIQGQPHGQCQRVVELRNHQHSQEAMGGVANSSPSPFQFANNNSISYKDISPTQG